MLSDSEEVEAGRRRGVFRHPAQVVVTAFAAVIVLGTLLLMLPVAKAGEGSATLTEALFTATSAVCVTGLVVVDTPTYWSGFGEAVILGLFQVGGFGIMTFASLLGVLVARRMGLFMRLTAQAETHSLGLGGVRGVVFGVIKVSLLFEAVTMVLLTMRLWLGYDESLPRAAYLGLFHAVSGFNNAGFALHSDSLVRYVSDPWITLPITFAVIAGGLGFPVLFELRRRLLPSRRWHLHTKMTLSVTAILFFLGAVFTAGSEWRNPETLGALDGPSRMLASFTHSVMTRSGGFHSFDVGQMNDGTLLGTMVLMFIGGGSAGTAGGIKVTTFVLLFFVIWAEVRGERHVTAFDRELDHRSVRQALTVALLGVAAVMGAGLILLSITDLPALKVMFETVSAFGTNGLSAGITAEFPPAGQWLLAGLMFLGRLGPATLVSALALREAGRHYRLPEGRPIIG